MPKVVVAITDGRSQDEVKKNAIKLQHAGNAPEGIGVLSPECPSVSFYKLDLRRVFPVATEVGRIPLEKTATWTQIFRGCVWFVRF